MISKEILSLLKELADDLEAAIDSYYDKDADGNMQPVSLRRYHRDMETVRKAREIIQRETSGADA